MNCLIFCFPFPQPRLNSWLKNLAWKSWLNSSTFRLLQLWPPPFLFPDSNDSALSSVRTIIFSLLFICPQQHRCSESPISRQHCNTTLLSQRLISVATASVLQERVRWRQHCNTTLLSPLLISRITPSVHQERMRWQQHCHIILFSFLLISVATPSVIQEQVPWRQRYNTTLLSSPLKCGSPLSLNLKWMNF